MEKLLIISFQFHPVQTTGNFRIARFIKYLKNYEIDPILVCGTVDALLAFFPNSIVDTKLDNDILDELEIHRLPLDKPLYKSSKLKQLFTPIDLLNKCWGPSVLKWARDYLKKNNDIKKIYFTAPPFSLGETILKIANEFGLKLILDIRDPWAVQGQFPFYTRMHYAINRYYQNKLFKSAQTIIVVTDGLKARFLKYDKSLNTNKIHIVYNSHDKVFRESLISKASINDVEKFTICYIGAYHYDELADKEKKTKWWKRKFTQKLFYYPVKEDWKYMSPYYFLKLLNSTFKKYPLLKDKIVFAHIGGAPWWLSKWISEFKMDDNFLDVGLVRNTSLKEVVESYDCFLATSEKVLSGLTFTFPSKTFDYFKLQKPIIGIVCDGEYKNILSASGLSFIIDPDSVSDNIDNFVKFLYEKQVFNTNTKLLNEFSTEQQAKKLASIIRSL